MSSPSTKWKGRNAAHCDGDNGPWQSINNAVALMVDEPEADRPIRLATLFDLPRLISSRFLPDKIRSSQLGFTINTLRA